MVDLRQDELFERDLHRVRIDWISIQLGIVFGGLLYGIYNMIAPFNQQMANIDAGRRFLQGGIDGLFIGAVAGALAAFVNGRRLRLHRLGLTRYVVLYLTVLTILWVGILVNQLGGVFNFAGPVVVLALLVAARVVFWNFGGKAYEEEIVEAPVAAPPKKRRASKKKAEPTYIPEDEDSGEYYE
jgi:peptidoglycan/LPS O-acetylase OafA/YrhL